MHFFMTKYFKKILAFVETLIYNNIRRQRDGKNLRAASSFGRAPDS